MKNSSININKKISVKTKKQNISLAKNKLKAKENNKILPNKKNSKIEAEYLASIFEQANDIIIITDTEGNIEYVNPHFEKITGYKREEVLGKKPSLLKSGYHTLNFYKKLWDTISGGSNWSGILINRKKNGSLYHEEANIFPIKNSKGKILKFAAIKRDISERKKAEEEIVKQNRLFSNMIDAFTYPVYVIDANKGDIIVANSAAKAQNIKEGQHHNQINYGSKQSAYSGKPPKEYPMEIVKKTKEPVYMDFSDVDEHGNHVYRELYGYPIFDTLGNVIQIIEYIIDITDRKRSQEELIKLSQAVEQSLNIVMITNKDGIIEYVNPKFTEITGFEFQEVVGTKASSLGELAPEEKKLFWETLKTEGEWRGEFHNKMKNGESYWEYASIYAIKNSQDVVAHYIKDAVNISKRKEAEEELKAAKEKAEQASRFKSEFLANMSHEIRTPLNSILGFIELLLTTDLDRQQKEYFDTIKDSSKVLLGIIDDILDFSKIESGKLEIDNIKFYLKHELEPVVDMFVTRADEKHIELLYFIDPSLPQYIFGDPLRIKQVLNNLISNAIKFTPERGKILVEIKLMEMSENCHILFSVSDNGIGIPREKQNIIFNAFSQADSSISRKYGGTGLGLAISLHLVKAMGGELKIESEVGKGSRFYFELVINDFSGIDIFKRDYNFENLKCFLFMSSKDEKVQLDNIERYLKAFNIEVETFSSFDEITKFHFKTKNIIFLDYLSNTSADIRKIHDLLPEMPLILIANRMDHEFVTPVTGNVIKVIYKPVYASKIIAAILELVYNEKQQSQPEPQPEKKQKINFNATSLVAEDNSINQKLITLMLKEIGIIADLAKDGFEAVEKYKNMKYDIILMDINMPIMDGIEATTKILEIEKSKNLKHTPIIALTAKSIAGDRESILGSGMDDYLSKPISISKLCGALSQYLKADGPDTKAGSGNTLQPQNKITESAKNIMKTENQKSNPSDFNEKYDLDGIAGELGIDVEFLSNLIIQFITNFDNYFASILKSVRDLEFNSIYSEAHKLKGTASNLRLKKLADYFLQMELNARDNRPFEYSETLSQVKKEFDSLKTQFLQKFGD
jgi:two-component system, sensor histidine kinase and response regulator